MTVTVKHSKTNAITDWTQAQLDEQIALGNFAPGTTLANIVLPSDWNNNHTLTGVGTMAEQDATAVVITGGTINNTTIGATTASTGAFTSVTTPSVTATTTDLTLSAISTGAVVFNTLNGTGLRLSELTGGTVNTGLGIYSGTSSQNTVYATPYGTFANSNMYLASKGSGNLFLGTNSNNSSVATTQTLISHTASAVNYVQVTGAAASGYPSFSAQGSDANPGIYYTTKGFGSHRFTTNTGGGSEQFRIITNSASTVNFLQVVGSATTLVPQFSVQGTDTNVSLAIQSKGTGAIDLAAGSSGVNISNGGTVTAITRSAAGSAYTTPPTVAISAPTTSGGVQATATVTIGLVSVTSVASGGTGYTVGDVLTVAGGTFTVACQVTVTAVSGGVITAASVTTGGSYTVAPTNPASVTGGTGSSATFNLSFCIGSTFTITAAGSGYVEQPTVTFSGGGGSGAAAYATVGSGTQIKSLGSTLSFYTPGGESFRIVDNGQSNVNFWGAKGAATGNAPSLAMYSTSSVFANIDNTNANSIGFRTNVNVTQAVISHTASAVNYVQVTGAATTGTPVVQAQGSDTNVSLAIRARGGGNLFFQPNSLNQFAVTQTASAVNYLQATGSATGAAPAFSVAGTDTDIDLALTPKGTGNVRFGTYTGTILSPTGYITIKDSGGTTRRLLVG